jgi:hypothetical protein
MQISATKVTLMLFKESAPTGRKWGTDDGRNSNRVVYERSTSASLAICLMASVDQLIQDHRSTANLSWNRLLTTRRHSDRLKLFDVSARDKKEGTNDSVAFLAKAQNKVTSGLSLSVTAQYSSSRLSSIIRLSRCHAINKCNGRDPEKTHGNLAISPSLHRRSCVGCLLPLLMPAVASRICNSSLLHPSRLLKVARAPLHL